MGVFYATTIGFLTLFTTPAPYVSCIGQAACRDFDKENTMGSGTAIFEGSCRASGTGRLCCGLRKPPCALAPSCHFTFLFFACCHAVCWTFMGNFWGKGIKGALRGALRGQRPLLIQRLLLRTEDLKCFYPKNFTACVYGWYLKCSSKANTASMPN